MARATASRAAERAMRTLLVDRIAGQVVSELSEAGIPSILLKGASVAAWLYDDTAERSYIDCDVLVAPADIAQTQRVLGSLGYRLTGLSAVRADWPRHARAFVGPEGIAVDLHRTLPGSGVSDERVWSILSERTASMRVGGADVDVLDEPARALSVALHAAKDGSRSPKARADVERAAARLPLETWREAAAVAEALAAVPAFGAGLRWGPAGRRVAEELRLPTRVPAEFVLRQGVPPPMAVGLDWLLRSGRGMRLQILRSKLFPSEEFLRAWYPPARRGRLELLVARVWRPIWVLVHAVPAASAVLRARRSVGRGRGDVRRP